MPEAFVGLSSDPTGGSPAGSDRVTAATGSSAERWGVSALIVLLLLCWELSVAIVCAVFVGVSVDGARWGWLALGATVLFGVTTGPLLVRWLQPALTALLASHWDNAQGVITEVGQRLRQLPAGSTDPNQLVQEIVDQVAQRLRLPYVAIVPEGDGEPVASARSASPGPGGAAASSPVQVPLSFAGEPMGTLLAAPRARERGLSVEDLALLNELAVHIAMTLHATRSTRDLQDSRLALIAAREEERRRIRRDLHDGLGPTLASLRLHLAAVEALINSDPDQALELVGRLRREVAGTSGQVRTLVYGLRPPLLDELGLAEALRSQVAATPGLTLVVEGAEHGSGLPAAVEVALYRIASEAVANVVRHAGARQCRVRLFPLAPSAEAPAGIRLEVGDDGRGLPEPLVVGVGLAAMRERTEELGGQLDLASGPAGTTVTVVLPWGAPDERAEP